MPKVLLVQLVPAEQPDRRVQQDSRVRKDCRVCKEQQVGIIVRFQYLILGSDSLHRFVTSNTTSVERVREKRNVTITFIVRKSHWQISLINWYARKFAYSFEKVVPQVFFRRSI